MELRDRIATPFASIECEDHCGTDPQLPPCERCMDVMRPAADAVIAELDSDSLLIDNEAGNRLEGRR